MSTPNVVFIIADQHRWDFVGWEDNGETDTPHLDRLAERGAVFRSAYCNAPLCSPSREILAAGRYGVNCGCFTNLHQLPPHTPTFVSQLRNAGYRTAAIGKTHMEIHAYDADYTSDEHAAFMDSLGWDEVCEISGNGMLRSGIRCAYSEFLRQAGMLPEVVRFYEQWHYFMERDRGGDPNFVCHPWSLPDEFQETTFVGQRAVEWLRNYCADAPYFLHVGFAGPHSPIEPAAEFWERYCQRTEPPAWNCRQPPPWLADGRRGYRAMITQIDHWVGRIMQAVDERGESGNTLFVYTADHGEMAGDHRSFGKTRFFEGAMRVPLIMAGPGILRGIDCNALVELIDLGATVCELCGVGPHGLDQGRSLTPILCGEKERHRETVYAEMGCDRMLFDGRYKLMWGDPGLDRRKLGRLHLDKPVTIAPSPPRLYDLQADPREERDLSDDPDSQSLMRAMLERLLARYNENVQPQPNLSRGEYKPLRF